MHSGAYVTPARQLNSANLLSKNYVRRPPSLQIEWHAQVAQTLVINVKLRFTHNITGIVPCHRQQAIEAVDIAE